MNGWNKKRSTEDLVRVMVGIVVLLIIAVLFLFWYVFDISRQSSLNIDQTAENGTSAEMNISESQKAEEYLELSNNDPEVGGIVRKVSKHMLIPTGEISVGTVEDAEMLRQKNPSLFKYVRNGDKLLMYQGGMIVYDPVGDKIVDAVRMPDVNTN